MATTYNNLFLDTRARLKKAGVEGAQLEAREICATPQTRAVSSCTEICPSMCPPSWSAG